MNMAHKENIYCVDSVTNTIVRVSRTYLTALEFHLTIKQDSIFICTSALPLKKGDQMSDVVEVLEC